MCTYIYVYVYILYIYKRIFYACVPQSFTRKKACYSRKTWPSPPAPAPSSPPPAPGPAPVPHPSYLASFPLNSLLRLLLILPPLFFPLFLSNLFFLALLLLHFSLPPSSSISRSSLLFVLVQLPLPPLCLWEGFQQQGFSETMLVQLPILFAKALSH